MPGRSNDAASNPSRKSAVPPILSCVADPYTNRMRQRTGAFTRKAGVVGAYRALFLLFAVLMSCLSPASAQVPIQTVVVLDFATAQGIDPILGRKAADALAVELQRSGDYEVVPRQQVEQAFATQPGLAPPFNESTQARLAQAVNARGVFSGLVVASQVTNGRSARVTLETRLLDAASQDFINGTVVSESTEDQLTQMTAEVLVDQALNKAAVTAVRRIKQQPIPTGTVLNTTVNDAELNIGARVGAAVGQRYSVLRDVFNRSKDRVERVKIGEVVVTRVEADQSSARIAGNNIGGVKTGDKVRLIFAPNTYPVNPTTGASMPQATVSRSSGGKSNSKSGIAGIAALALLAAVFGLGGGGGAPKGVRAQTIQPNPATESPRISINYSAGVPRLTVPRECIIGFFIYRGLSEDSTIDTRRPIDFQFGTANAYTDDIDRYLQREVDVDAPDDDESTDPCPPPQNVVNSTTAETASPSSRVDFSEDGLDSEFTQSPLIPGVQYFYRVRRLTTERRTNSDGDAIYNLVLSEPSAAAGPATALIRPQVIRTSGDFNSNFAVTINGLTAIPNAPPITGTTPPFVIIPAFTDQAIRFLIQLSNDPTFRTGVFEVPQPNRAPDANGEITFNLGAVQATGVDTTEPVYIRVNVTNPTDQSPQVIFGPRTDVTFGAGAQGTRAVVRDGKGKGTGTGGLPGTPRPGTTSGAGNGATPPRGATPGGAKGGSATTNRRTPAEIKRSR